MSALKTKIDKPIWQDCIELWFFERHPDGRLTVSSSLIMQTQKQGEVVTAEPIRLSMMAAQELIDQLWQAGLRPSEGSGSAGAMAATERHLADMRSLVFKMTPKA